MTRATKRSMRETTNTCMHLGVYLTSEAIELPQFISFGSAFVEGHEDVLLTSLAPLTNDTDPTIRK